MEKEKKNRNDKEEEITSLTDNKETLKKKKFRKIALQKINLGTKPINISLSKYEILDYANLSANKKNRIKIISIIIIIVIVIIILLTLTGTFHHSNNNEIIDNKNLDMNVYQNTTLNSNNASSFLSSGNISFPSRSPSPSPSHSPSPSPSLSSSKKGSSEQ